MTRTITTSCMASVLAIVAGTALHADVTAQDVWADWQGQLALYGEDGLSIGAETASGNTLTISDLALTIEDETSIVVVEMDQIVFEETGDGSVSVTFDDSYPIVLTEKSEDVTVTVDFTSQGQSMVVTGDPNALNYAMVADEYGFELREVVSGDVSFAGDASVKASAIDVIYTSEIGDLRTMSYAGSVGSIDVLVDFQIPGGAGEYVTGGGKIDGVDIQLTMDVPLDADFEDPDTLIADGFAMAGGYILGGSDYVFDINADGDQAAGSVSNGGTTFTGEISANRFGYDISSESLAVNVQSSDLPLPIEVSLAKYGFDFSFPTAAVDTPQPFNLGFDLTDLVVSDAIWNLFDPAAMLPRTPATIEFALTGQGRALFDLFDPAQAMAISGAEMPVELSSVDLSALTITAAGADVRGSGSFTFDNTDTQTFAPLPRPEGSATLVVTGLNGLLDTVVAMGLVPEQDIMGARMMMGMFARTTGDDVMESTLDVLPNGQVNVNGNRIR